MSSGSVKAWSGLLTAVVLAAMAAAATASSGPPSAGERAEAFLSRSGLTAAPPVHAVEALDLGAWHAAVWPSPTAGPVDPPAVVLAAPAETPDSPFLPASFAYPEVTGLSDFDSDERAVPLARTEVLGMGPGGYGQVLMGNPGLAHIWPNGIETAISYIRPHVNVQMTLALQVPGGEEGVEFEGPGFRSNALLNVDHRTKVRSDVIGSSSSQFGLRPPPQPVDEAQTGMAVGLDLGILPTFLSQMGLNLSVVASRGADSGDVTVAVVGTTELPVDWTPPERPRQHPIGFPENPLAAPPGPGLGFHAASVGSGRPPGDEPPGEPPTPITPEPPIPEPATIALLGTGLAAVLLGRRRRTRRPGR